MLPLFSLRNESEFVYDFECAFLSFFFFFLIIIDMPEGQNRAFSVQPDYAYIV